MAIAFVNEATGYQNAGTTATATLPAAATSPGVTFAFMSLSDVIVGDPTPSGGGAGTSWVQVGSTVDDNVLRTNLWRKVVTSGDAGATITSTWTGSAKGAIMLMTYSGTHASSPIGNVGTAIEGATDGTHDTPGVVVTTSGVWVVEFVSQRSSACLTITAPGGRTERSQQLGTGAGTVCQIGADSAATVAPGASGTATYTFDQATANAVGWSVELLPTATTTDPPRSHKSSMRTLLTQ